MMLERTHANRYMLSMREGGSMPALLGADDDRQYVVKLRGAGQGPRVLAAEFLVGEIARRLELRVPHLAGIELDAMFGKSEPDPEVRELFQRSAGLNLGLEYLPQSTVFDPVAGDRVSAQEASRVVWLDAFTRNVDRTPRNANLLMKDGRLWLIDHGASMIFHFHWPSAPQKAVDAFAPISQHILLPFASEIKAASAWAHERLTPSFLDELIAAIPDEFLPEDDGVSVADQREGYSRFFAERLKHSAIFEEEIRRVRTQSL
ncbi:HipA family kinase [Granulicella cerasi]|uniref:HipA family kinase n=1 Tax=Granulicella cerasi TaxID=741063 RepID=A0ABW1Z7H8_9BACT|nr:HipA family kinase [Granulicella cerasi]